MGFMSIRGGHSKHLRQLIVTSLLAVIGVAGSSSVVAADIEISGGGSTEFGYAGVITSATQSFLALTPPGHFIAGPVGINATPGGATMATSDFTSSLLQILGENGAPKFCFPWNMTCLASPEGGTVVQIVSIDSVDLVFDSDSCPVSGLIMVTAFSSTFQLDLPVTLDITNGTFHTEAIGLGEVDGVGNFTCSMKPEISPSPNPADALNFGSAQLGGDAGTPQVITLQNTGNGISIVEAVYSNEEPPILVDSLDIIYGALNIGAISLTGNTDNFAIVEDCSGMAVPANNQPVPTPPRLPIDDDCTVSVQFTPNVANNADAILTILSDDEDESSVVYTLKAAVVFGEILINAPLEDLETIEGIPTSGTWEVENIGEGVLNIDQILEDDLALPFSFVSDTCSTAAILPGATCEIEVQFAPESEGPFTEDFTIVSDDPNNEMLTIEITANAIKSEAILVATPASIVFSNVSVFDVVTRVFEIENTGNTDLTISALDGLDAPFSVSTGSTCMIGEPIMPGPEFSCTIEITFAPEVPGTTVDFDDMLIIVSNDESSPHMLSVKGSATLAPEPNIFLDPDSLNLDFGPVLLESSTTLSIEVTNTGNADLMVLGLDIDPVVGFSATANNCAVVAQDGGTCTIDVTYTASIAGSAEATLTIASNDPDMMDTLVTLTAVGVAPAPEITVTPPDEVDLGSVVIGDTATAEVVVDNIEGTADLTIGMITISGTNAAEFLQDSNCTTLMAGESCTITVTYRPNADGGAEATLTIPSNDTDEPTVDVLLIGIATVVTMPIISAPATVDAGDVNIGTSGTADIVVTNDGTADLTISEVVISGADFAINDDACSTAPVASMATCTITVAFNAATAGPSMATVTITSNDATNPMTDVTVTGNGIVVIAMASVDISNLEFGGVALGEASTQVLTITNAGNGVLGITGVSITGADAASFSAPNVCATIAPFSACNLVVSYAPKAGSSGGATLTITTDDPALASVAIQLSAAIEEVLVSVTSQAGKGSVGGLELFGLGLLAVWVRRRKLIPVLAVAGLMASSAVYAQELEKSGYWYLSAGSGSSTGQADEGNVRRAIEAAGVSVSTLSIDDSDNGWKMLVGYQASERLAIEVGYSDLGTAGIDLQLGSVSVAQLPLVSRAISNNLSLLGNGTHGSVVFKQPFKENLAVFARVGLMAWEIESSISGTAGAGSVNVRQIESGTDLMFGVGAEMWLENSRFGLTLEWERYEFGPQDAELVTLNGKFRF